MIVINTYVMEAIPKDLVGIIRNLYKVTTDINAIVKKLKIMEYYDLVVGMTSGRGFGDTVRYELDVYRKDPRYFVSVNGSVYRNEKETEILHAEGVDVILGLDGRLHGDPDRIAQSFRIQADINPRVQQCVKHLYLAHFVFRGHF